MFSFKLLNTVSPVCAEAMAIYPIVIAVQLYPLAFGLSCCTMFPRQLSPFGEAGQLT